MLHLQFFDHAKTMKFAALCGGLWLLAAPWGLVEGFGLVPSSCRTFAVRPALGQRQPRVGRVACVGGLRCGEEVEKKDPMVVPRPDPSILVSARGEQV